MGEKASEEKEKARKMSSSELPDLAPRAARGRTVRVLPSLRPQSPGGRSHDVVLVVTFQ